MRKGGKEDDKVMGPMFPRLHVNDTEKGGPRAPPRNKMALYEQLSIPSQRYNNTCQRWLFNSNNKTSNNSIQLENGSERSRVFPLHVPTPSSQAKLQTLQSDTMNLNSPLVELEQSRNVGEEDDFTVPIYFQSDMDQCVSKNQSSKNGEKGTACTTYSGHSNKTQRSSGNNLERTGLTTPYLDVRSQGEMNPKEGIITGPYSAPYDKKMSPVNKIVQPVKPVNASALLKSGDLTTNCESLCARDATLHQILWARMQPKDFCDSPCVEDACREKSACEPVIGSGYLGDQTRGSCQVENADRNDDVSENSMVDSISESDISPDDVVGIIGYKHFLRARKAITNQQRVFAVQVFELHRLIKVQKLIARSPQFLVDDNAHSKYSVKSPSALVKQKHHSEKPNHDKECTAENVVKLTIPSLTSGSTLLPHHKSNTGKPPPMPAAIDAKMPPWCFPQPPGQQWLVPIMSPSEGLIYKPYPGPAFMGPVYGGCGPVGGVAPTPLTQGNFMNSAYAIPGYPPPHHQGIGILPGAFPVGHGYSYLPPYCMPVNNPALSGSAVKQMNPFAGPVFHSQTVPPSDGAAYSNLQHQSSCNSRGQKSRSVTQAMKSPAPKGSELQGSTASSPGEKSEAVQQAHSEEEGDALPLFPVDPSIPGVPSQCNDVPDEPARVIRVVPHNARTATESAARIFQSIQEERKQFDLS